jgi:AcrR family transcriptional regulator
MQSLGAIYDQKESAMSLKKVGRPAEDRLARQREIYEAISPLLREPGVRDLSMRQVADTACLSIGGLYHYFPTKHDLALHGIKTETISRLCQDFHQQNAHLASNNLRLYFNLFYQNLVKCILFMRPSAYAASELGVDVFEMVSKNIEAAAVEFATTLRLLAPTLPEAHIQTVARAIRRFSLGTLIDTTSTDEDIRKEFYLLIGGSLDKEGVFLDIPTFFPDETGK